MAIIKGRNLLKKLGLLRPNSIDSDVLRASVKSSGASLEDFDENLPEEVKHRKGREHYKSWFENANPPVVTDVAGRKRLKIEGVLAYQNWHDTENPGVMQYKDYTGGKAILLDLDTYVEQFNPHWIWDNDQQKEKDQLNARVNFTKDIDKYLGNKQRIKNRL